MLVYSCTHDGLLMLEVSISDILVLCCLAALLVFILCVVFVCWRKHSFSRRHRTPSTPEACKQEMDQHSLISTIEAVPQNVTARDSSEVKVIRMYFTKLINGIELADILLVFSGYLFSNKVISHGMHCKVTWKKMDTNELLTALIGILQTSCDSRQMFQCFVHSLRQLDDITEIVTCLESTFLSTIRLKLVGEVCKECDCSGDDTIILKVMDSREHECKKKLWMTLQLDEVVDKRTNQGVLKTYSKHLVIKVVSSEPGCIKLIIHTKSPSEYSIRFSLSKLFVRGNAVNKFQCDDVVLIIPNELAAISEVSTIYRERGYFYIAYEDELTGDDFDRVCETFRQLLLENNHEQTSKLVCEISNDNLRKPVEISFFMCYHAITLSHCRIDAKLFLYEALEKVRDGDNNNELLVKGRIHRVLAGIYNSEGNETEALNNIQKCKKVLEAARPSCEKACVLIQEARILKKRADFNPETIAGLFKSAHMCILQCKDSKRQALMLPMASVERALFLLEFNQVGEAKECLKDFKNCPRINKNNIYRLKFLVAQSDTYRLSRDYKKAHEYIQQSVHLVQSGKIAVTEGDEEELGIHKKMAEITKKLE